MGKIEPVPFPFLSRSRFRFNEDGAGRIDAPDYNAFLTNLGKRFKNVTTITTI